MGSDGQTSRIGKITGLVLSLSLLILSLFLVFQWQSVYDWVRLRGYNPPSEISELVTKTEMTDYGQKLFYVNHPQFNDSSSFRTNCTTSEATIVLGCYVSRTGIYIFDVQDKRLAGIEEVTAAHEMLHVGYERLGSSERAHVDNLTAQAFKGLDDNRIQATIEQYRKADPSVVPNELHSILGTEVANLPKELEDYYKRYFDDRQAVVKLSARYEKEFTQRENQIKDIDIELDSLKQRIDSNEAEISSLNSELATMRADLENNRRANKIDAYNDLASEYNVLVRTYNQLIEDSRSAIATYNSLVRERNNIALEEQDLYKSLDSRSLPQAAQ